jgi:hypothetical protein
MLSVIYNEYSDLNELFDRIYKENKSKYICVSYTDYNYKQKYNKIVTTHDKENIKYLIMNTQKIVIDKNFKINPSNYYVEFHKYIVNGKTKPFTDFHQDDYGAVSFKTVTCIYYLEKDSSIEGGDLEIKNETIINIDSNMLVIFNGNLIHRVTMMNGYGVRKCIVIQFERL